MSQVDWEFIESLEGPGVTRGYVPPDGDEGDVGVEPGVTVAAGVDLGHTSESKLYDYGISPSLIDVLSPYIGVTGTAAVALLEERPLTISRADADHLDHCLRLNHERRVARHWDEDSMACPWDDVSMELVTVVMSVAWQYGSPWRRCPKFWAAATSLDHDAVEDELRDFGDSHPTRRNREADYLTS